MLNCVAALSLREAAQRSIPAPSPPPVLPSSSKNHLKILKNLKKIDLNTFQISARFSFRVVWFVHATVTHPTLQPPLMVSILFIYFIIYLFISFSSTSTSTSSFSSFFNIISDSSVMWHAYLFSPFIIHSIGYTFMLLLLLLFFLFIITFLLYIFFHVCVCVYITLSLVKNF